jgi:hypothetical protein
VPRRSGELQCRGALATPLYLPLPFPPLIPLNPPSSPLVGHTNPHLVRPLAPEPGNILPAVCQRPMLAHPSRCRIPRPLRFRLSCPPQRSAVLSHTSLLSPPYRARPSPVWYGARADFCRPAARPRRGPHQVRKQRWAPTALVSALFRRTLLVSSPSRHIFFGSISCLGFTGRVLLPSHVAPWAAFTPDTVQERSPKATTPHPQVLPLWHPHAAATVTSFPPYQPGHRYPRDPGDVPFSGMSPKFPSSSAPMVPLFLPCTSPSAQPLSGFLPNCFFPFIVAIFF